jgi:hypothetical protein
MLLLCPEYLFQKLDPSAPYLGWRTLRSSSVKSSNVSKNDENTPPESLTPLLKKAETAVEVATRA